MSQPERHDGNYESRAQRDAYLLLHFGDRAATTPFDLSLDGFSFPARCARRLLDQARADEVPTRRALDLGCAVGGSSFELARDHHEVVGLDFSQSFIDCAVALAEAGSLDYTRLDEGELTTQATAEVDPAIDRARLRFIQGDACALPDDLQGPFDAVLLGNLLCRLPDPARALDALPDLMAPRGLLLITSPFTWREEFTPRDHWLGGRTTSAGPLHSADGLKRHLDPHFELIEEDDWPLVIREHRRKYQLIVAHMGLWRRRP